MDVSIQRIVIITVFFIAFIILSRKRQLNNKTLLKYKELFEHYKWPRFTAFPLMRGQFDGRDAELAIGGHKREAKIHYRIRLKSPAKTSCPKCLLLEEVADYQTQTKYASIDLENKRWVTLNIVLSSDISKYAGVQTEEYFAQQSVEEVQEKFIRLSEFAQKIEDNDMDWKRIKKENKQMRRDT